MKICHEIPGNIQDIQDKLNEVSVYSMTSEIQKWKDSFNKEIVNLNFTKEELIRIFGVNIASYEISRYKNHFTKSH